MTTPLTAEDSALVEAWTGTAPTVSAVRVPCETREEWLTKRQGGIGASDVGVIMGVSTWASRYALWWRKKEGWHLPQTEAQQWGHLVEDPIAELFQEDIGVDVLRVFKPIGHPYSLWRHPLRQWASCTPDRLGVLPDGTVVPVELKSDEGGTGWGAPETDEVPPHHRCQAMWQAWVFGAPGTYIVRKRASGKRRLVWYWVPFNERECAEYVLQAEDFLASLELDDTPEPDGSSSTTAVLQDLNPVVPGEWVNVPADVADEWLAAREAKREALAREKLASNMLRAHMATAEYATRTTDDGLAVAFVKRRVGKRDGYTVAPTTVDELRQVGGQRNPDADVRPEPPVDPGATPSNGEERPGDGDPPRAEMGGGEAGRSAEEGVAVMADPWGDGQSIHEASEPLEGMNEGDRQTFIRGLPPELGALVDRALETDTPLITRQRPDRDCET